jgi:hypothetical protein
MGIGLTGDNYIASSLLFVIGFPISLQTCSAFSVFFLKVLSQFFQ